MEERKQMIIKLQELSKQIAELTRIETEKYQKLLMEHKSKSGKRKTRRKKN